MQNEPSFQSEGCPRIRGEAAKRQQCLFSGQLPQFIASYRRRDEQERMSRHNTPGLILTSYSPAYVIITRYLDTIKQTNYGRACCLLLLLGSVDLLLLSVLRIGLSASAQS